MRRSFALLVSALWLAACSSSSPTGSNPPNDPPPSDPPPTPVSGINTAVDSQWVYGFEKTKFVPPDDRSLLIMGQTLEQIDAYVTSYPDKSLPAGFAAYWGIPSTAGLTTDSCGSDGFDPDCQNHQKLVDRYPNTVLQSAMWMVGTNDVAGRTASGEWDQVVRDFSTWAKSVNRPIYLRIGYEFDGVHNELQPLDYVQAYRRIVDITRAEGVTNVAFVWHSYGAPPFGGYDVSAWYPGDDYVDWVALSIFGQIYNGAASPYIDDVFEFARDKKKPMMFAESNPVSGISPGNRVWENWFEHFFTLAYERNVKAISFISQDWTRNPGLVDLGWRDARLQNDPALAPKWFEETEKPHYLKASPQLFGQLGFGN